MKSAINHLILLLLIGFFPVLLSAQPVNFPMQKRGKTLDSLTGLISRSGTDFKSINLDESSFPIVILPLDPIESALRQLINFDVHILGLEAENRLLSQRDTLTSMENARLKSLIAVHERNIQLCESTNSTLNASITSLNNQLDQTRKLAEDCNKARSAKSIWGVILGGGIGLGVGAILGILVAK